MIENRNIRRLHNSCSEQYFDINDPSVQSAIEFLHEDVDLGRVTHDDVREALKDTKLPPDVIEDIIDLLPYDSKKVRMMNGLP